MSGRIKIQMTYWQYWCSEIIFAACWLKYISIKKRKCSSQTSSSVGILSIPETQGVFYILCTEIKLYLHIIFCFENSHKIHQFNNIVDNDKTLNPPKKNCLWNELETHLPNSLNDSLQTIYILIILWIFESYYSSCQRSSEETLIQFFITYTTQCRNTNL